MLDELSREDRLRLVKFVCSFAWADLEVQDEERNFVHGLLGKLELEDEDTALVNEWLKVPPPPEEVDPANIPRQHRELFLKTMRELIAADDHIDPDESENLKLLEQLLV